MPDTIRTLAALNQQFADNTEGVISPQDIRDLMVSQMVYGEIGSGAKGAITLSAGFNKLDLTVAGTVGRGLNIDTVNKQISGVPCEMKAEVSLEVNFNGANNTTFTFAVFRTPSGGAAEQLLRLTDTDRIVAASQQAGVNISSSIQLNAGDTLHASVSAGAVSFTLLRGRLYVKRIAVE